MTETKDRLRGISKAKKRQKTVQWLGANLNQESDARHHSARSGQASCIGLGGPVPHALANRDQLRSPQADDEDGFTALPDGPKRPEGSGDVRAGVQPDPEIINQAKSFRQKMTEPKGPIWIICQDAKPL